MIKTTNRRKSLKQPIRRANKRLTLMGLDPTIKIEDKDAYIIIPLTQLVKLIDSKIAHPHKDVSIIDEKVVIHVWKGKKQRDDLEAV